ncbi:MAG: hypothetical protein FGM14_10195 [Flavobacteriales bacterium]|nr:hypothetical protein [Flavobacteriales bacterium]
MDQKRTKLIMFFFIISLTTNIFAQNEVKIGNYVWMTKNLNVSTFKNGEKIQQATNEKAFWELSKAKMPAWCYKDFDPKNEEKYGKLYNYYAVEDPRGLAPEGWTIPDEDDFYNFKENSNSDILSGAKFKSKSGWINYSVKEICPLCENKTLYCSKCQGTGEVLVTYSGNGTNSFGFSALPSGQVGGYPDENKNNAVFWLKISNENNKKENGDSRKEKAPCFYITYDNYFSIRDGGYLNERKEKSFGYSVRCVKENEYYKEYRNELNRLAEEKRKRIDNSPGNIFNKQYAKTQANYKNYPSNWQDLRKNDIESFTKIQQTIINEWQRLDSLNKVIKWEDCYPIFSCRQDHYSGYYTSVNDLVSNLVDHKKIEKAKEVVDQFIDYNFPVKNEKGLNMASFELLCQKANNHDNEISRNSLNKIKEYILLISIINDSKFKLDILQHFLCTRDSRNNKPANIYYYIDEYLVNKLGYKVTDSDYLKFTINALTNKWDFKISPNAKSKSWLQTYSSYFNKYLEDELYVKNKKSTELIIKLEENLYKSKIGDFNIYYYLDKTGTAYLVNKSDATISKEKESKLILKVKQIRDADLLELKNKF